ncbi:MAG: ATP phosphoribosyltransferase regulatory subunit [Clostridia bacterium]|nr:ATP phosphoribosyltransferase regulatory subunit [Clostridia bacterium]
MTPSKDVLRSDERAIYALRELYRKFGYSQYRVGKFEEYDLYARNKSFLVSENVLTFTDTNGKLMALKPDVTLSIVKNISFEEGVTHKLYYNENVYRTSAESHGFKEIMQTGLECVGDVDIFAESEVVMLALRSLESISNDYILDISHMGIVEGLLDSEDTQGADRDDILGYVKSKNTAAMKKLVTSGRMSEKLCDTLCKMTQMYTTLAQSLSIIEEFVTDGKMRAAYDELRHISDTMSIYGLSDKLYFDFSVVNDCNYYDGVIFKGFINGIPDSVLSGGRYDRLLLKMGKKCGAIGFAVYLDALERFGKEQIEYDTDVLLIYDTDTESKSIIDTVNLLSDSGKTVKTARRADEFVRYRQLLKIGKGGIEILETND